VAETFTLHVNGATHWDWPTCPIVEMPDAPKASMPSRSIIATPRSRARGKARRRPAAGAIADALFDASGVRLRRAPLTAARAALG